MTEVGDGISSHPATWPEGRLLKYCSSRRQRRSGPGGQHRNKVETAVVYEHEPTSVTGSANEKRSQEANRKMALFRLRVNLALAVRCSAQPQCSELWSRRCARGKLQVNPRHQDFPSLLSEALDQVLDSLGDLEPAAALLQCSKSKLFKFLKLEPRAAQLVNDVRESQGLKRLK